VIPGKELLFCALGGSGEIGMNVNLYGCQGKWLMVDLGMTFSGNEYPGVDLVFADLEFIENEREKLLGIVLTHAHEDHIGAVPYFAQELGVPLYATPFTAKLVAAKLEEAGILDEIELNVVHDLEISTLVRSASAMSRWRTRSPRATRWSSRRPMAASSTPATGSLTTSRRSAPRRRRRN